MPKKKKIEEDNLVEKSQEELDLERTIEMKVIEDAKNQKKGEFSAFLILLLIAAILIGGVYIWYTKFYDSSRDRWFKEIVDTVNKEKYDVISYKTDNNLKLVDKYLIEYKDNVIYKIFKDNELLFEGEQVFKNIYVSLDNELYIVLDEYIEYENVLTLYKLNNKTIDEVKTYSEASHTFKVALYNNKLVGILEEYPYYDEEDYETKTCSKLIFLNDTTYQINNGIVVSKNNINNEVLLSSKDYLVTKSSLTNKYGIYSIIDQKQLIGYKYEDLVFVKDNIFIAKQNNKYGIIDIKLKKLLDFNYDLLVSKDDFIYGIRDNKLFIINNEYKEVSYIDNINNLVVNNVYKFNNKYVIDFKDSYYLLDIDNGKYEKLDVSSINYINDLFYTYNKNSKIYNVYDEDFNIINTLDLSSYDISEEKLYLVNDNTYVVGSNNYIYFDKDNNNELDNLKDYEYDFNDIKVKYDSSTNMISITLKDKEKSSFKMLDHTKDSININDDSTFYYLDNNMYVYVKKSE